MTLLTASGPLQNATKYCTKLCKTSAGDSRIFRPWFNIESPNFTWTSMPTQSTATLDMTSQLFLVYIYRSSKKRPKCWLWRLWVEFLWCNVLPAPPVGGLLVIITIILIKLLPGPVGVADATFVNLHRPDTAGELLSPISKTVIISDIWIGSGILSLRCLVSGYSKLNSAVLQRLSFF